MGFLIGGMGGGGGGAGGAPVPTAAPVAPPPEPPPQRDAADIDQARRKSQPRKSGLLGLEDDKSLLGP